MKEVITIVKSGFYSTIQDKGRFGYAHMGVPESGVMDVLAYENANLLLNNDAVAAVIEFTLTGPTIVFHCDRHFVVTGGNVEGDLDGRSVVTGKVFFAKAQQKLTLSKITKGCRGYLAIAGGFLTHEVLGSRSMCKPMTTTNTISDGMDILIGQSNYGMDKGARIKTATNLLNNYQTQETIKVFPGPEFIYLSKQQQKRLKESRFTVSKMWNRMAIQLEEKLDHTLPSIVTGPVLPGTVQLTPSGRLVILLKDCQTTGGYPRVLQLSNEGLRAIAQKKHGDSVFLSFL